MRKTTAIICLLFMLVSIVLPVHAEEAVKTEDSLYIPEDTLSALPIKAGDTVIRAYRCNDFSEHFVKYSSIDEVLAHASELHIHNFYIAKNTSDTITTYWYVDTKLTSAQNEKDWGTDLMNLHLSNKPQTIIKLVSPDIVVENTYYLVSAYGFSVYYKTNLGEYVYFVFDGYEGATYFDAYEELFIGEYLLSLTQFLELQKVFNNCWNVISGDPLSARESTLTIDLSAYQIGSANFDPDAPFPALGEKANDNGPTWLIVGIAVGVCLIGGIVIFILRRKKENPETIL